MNKIYWCLTLLLLFVQSAVFQSNTYASENDPYVKEVVRRLNAQIAENERNERLGLGHLNQYILDASDLREDKHWAIEGKRFIDEEKDKDFLENINQKLIKLAADDDIHFYVLLNGNLLTVEDNTTKSGKRELTKANEATIRQEIIAKINLVYDDSNLNLSAKGNGKNLLLTVTPVTSLWVGKSSKEDKAKMSYFRYLKAGTAYGNLIPLGNQFTSNLKYNSNPQNALKEHVDIYVDVMKNYAALDDNNLCEEGKEFVAKYQQEGLSPKSLTALTEVAQAICEYPESDLLKIFGAESKAKFDEVYNSWWIWGSDQAKIMEAQNEFWNTENAWEKYNQHLQNYLALYKQLKSELEKGNISNRNLKSLVNARTSDFMDLYSLEDRIDIIKNLLPEDDKVVNIDGSINYAELMVTNGEENAIIKVLQSIENKADAEKAISNLSSESFLEDLNTHLDDFGFGGNNYTRLAKEFQRISILNHGVDNTNYLTYLEDDPNAHFFLWNNENLFFPNEKDGVIVYDKIDRESDQIHIEYRVTDKCVTTTEYIDRGNGSSIKTTTECEYKAVPPITLNYFHPVIVSIQGDFSDVLPETFNTTVATGFVTYAGFLEYLDTKKSTAQIIKIADYTLTTASLALGVGEVVLIVRAGATAGRVAIASWQLGSEIVDLSMRTEAFEKWCVDNPTECSNVKTGALINNIANLSAAGILVAKNWDAIKGARNLASGAGKPFARLLNKSSLSASDFNKLDNSLASSTPLKFDYNGAEQTAKQFLNEQGDNMFDLVLENGAYVKYDMSNGRMLFSEGDYHAFINYTKGNNLTVLSEIEQALIDRATKLRNCLGYNGSQSIVIFDRTIQTDVNKVTTFIGKTDETQLLKNQFGDFKHVQIGETPGSINLLNMPDAYWNPKTWFEDFNRDWMSRAINRGDDIYLASPINQSTLYNEFGGSYFAKELNEMIKGGKKPINIDLNTWKSLKRDIEIAASSTF